jgi:glycosyltransferase involved in cell wall biosynthesis
LKNTAEAVISKFSNSMSHSSLKSGEVMSHPRVSVCIPTYNYAHYLPQTIKSILCQSYFDLELLIVDDCSTDNTKEIVAEFARNDPRICFHVNQCNIGMVQNWNRCLADARGDYIKFVFGDDLLASPDALAQMVAVLDENKNVSLVASKRNSIDEHSNIIKEMSGFDHYGILSGTAVINYCLYMQKNLIGEPTAVMFRKAQSLRGFNNSYKQIVDMEMWFHLLEHGELYYINKCLCSFRTHNQQQTAKNKLSLCDIKDNFILSDEYLCKRYIKLSIGIKTYLKFDQLYIIWTNYKAGKITKQQMHEIMETGYGYTNFILYYLLYKSIKPLYKLFRKLHTLLLSRQLELISK